MLKKFIRSIDRLFVLGVKEDINCYFLVANGLLLEVPEDIKSPMVLNFRAFAEYGHYLHVNCSSLGGISHSLDIRVCRFSKNIYLEHDLHDICLLLGNKLSVDIKDSGAILFKGEFDTTPLKNKIYQSCGLQKLMVV